MYFRIELNKMSVNLCSEWYTPITDRVTYHVLIFEGEEKMFKR